MDFGVEVGVGFTQISHVEGLVEFCFEVSDGERVVARDQEVINVEEKNGEFVVATKIIQVWVTCTTGEA